jgi:hypothetical protein
MARTSFFQPLGGSERHARTGREHERVRGKHCSSLVVVVLWFGSDAMIVVYLPMTCSYAVLCLVTHPPTPLDIHGSAFAVSGFIVSASHISARAEAAVHYSRRKID